MCCIGTRRNTKFDKVKQIKRVTDLLDVKKNNYITYKDEFAEYKAILRRDTPLSLSIVIIVHKYFHTLADDSNVMVLNYSKDSKSAKGMGYMTRARITMDYMESSEFYEIMLKNHICRIDVDINKFYDILGNWFPKDGIIDKIVPYIKRFVDEPIGLGYDMFPVEL